MTIQANIWKLYVIKASKWMMLFMPIIWLFYKENGLTVKDLFIIQAINSLLVAITEIPSGYVADVLGRKNSLIIGTFFGCLGFIIYSLSFSFEGFLSATLCLGFGQSFISGSDTALMYDSLKELNREKDFIKLEGRTISMGNFAEGTAGMIGAYFLTNNSYRIPFYYQVGIAFIGFLIALLLVEPKTTKLSDGINKPWKNIKNIIRFSLIENKLLRYYILYSAIIGTTTLSIAWFAQPFLDFVKIEGKFNGIIFGLLNYTVAATAFYAHQIEKRFKTNSILISILLTLIACYYGISQFTHYYWAIPLTIFYFTRGIATPILRDYMNRETPSEMRATVMSIRSFIIRLLFASLSPFLGYYTDTYSIQEALLFSCILFFILGSIVLILLLSNKKTEATLNS